MEEKKQTGKEEEESINITPAVMNTEPDKDMNGILETDKDKEIEAVKGKILFKKK